MPGRHRGGKAICSEYFSFESAIPEIVLLRQAVAALELSEQARLALEEALTHSERRLQQRLARQEERLQQLGHLAGKILHDLRNPLNAMLLHADVLEEEIQQPSPGSQEQMQESLEQIRRELTSLYTIIQDYLTLGRLPVIAREPEDFGSFVQECVETFQESIPLSSHVLQIEGLHDLGEVALHKPTMAQAMHHLFTQALETLAVNGRLLLRGHSSTEQVHLEIHYPCRGNFPSSEELLADPLSHPGQTWADMKVFVARHILLAHGGMLEIHREPEQTISFGLILPLAPAQEPETSSEENAK